jgi:hypothetical protein
MYQEPFYQAVLFEKKTLYQTAQYNICRGEGGIIILYFIGD